MVVLLAIISVSAYGFEVDGIAYFIESDNTVSVTSKTEKYSGSIVIPSEIEYQGKKYTVTSIGAMAFCNCSSLFAVTVPNTVSQIGYSAFYGCKSLSNISLPSLVDSIPEECFAFCSNLQTIKLPEQLKSIGKEAFDYCSALQTINFPNSLQKIGEFAFSQCTMLNTITIPASLANIPSGCFHGCRNLTDVELNNGISRIGSFAFYTYSDIYLHFPPSIEYIDQNVIYSGGIVLYRGNVQLSQQKSGVYIAVLDSAFPTIIEKGNAHLFLVSPQSFLSSNNYSSSNVSSIGEYGQKDNEYIYWYDGTPQPLIKSGLNSFLPLQKMGIEWYCSDFDVKDAGYYSGNTTIEARHNNWSNSFPISYAFKILKAELTIRVNDCEKTYGDENPHFTFEASGFKADDNTETSINNFVFNTPATINSEVGEYAITLSAESNNYDIRLTEGLLKVTQAPLTLQVNDTSRKYGESNPEFTMSFSGFKLNDTEKTAFSSLPIISCSASKTSDVGDYPITVNGGTSRNYEIVVYEDGVLKITKAPLILTASDNSRLYFEDNPSFDYTLSGLRNSDTKSCLSAQPMFTCTATKTSNVGDYVIEPSGASATNYNIEYRPGTLSVNRRQLEASVGNYTRIYGEDNPEFEVVYTGFVNNEDKSVLTAEANAICSAEKLSDVGTYLISVEGGSAINYLITQYNSGKLTITKADQTLIWNQNLSDIQRYSQIALEATSSAGLPVTYEMSPNNVATLYNNSGIWYLDCFGTGAVNIRAVQNGDKNHNAAPMISKTLVVSGTGGDPSNPQIYLNVEEAGTLPSLVAENRKYQIKNLRLTGYLNGTDVNFIREMAGSDSYGNKTVGILETLDISGCTIVSGGRSYYKSCYTDNFKISDYMFYNCKVLVNLMLPDNTTTIEDFAFADCDRLSVVSIPNEVKSFGNQSFRNDISLQRIPMPQSLTSIGDMAFMGCNGISDITLPLNVKTIGTGIVKDCQNISQINVESGNTNFASKNGVLYTYSFDKLLIFPANHNSTNYIINDETQKIASGAFVNAKNLSNVILPSSLQSIGRDAFIGCVNLSTITVDALTPPICENDCFEEVSKARCELRVPKGCYSYYWVAPVWSEFNKIVENKTSSINDVSMDNIEVSVDGLNIMVTGTPNDIYVRIYHMNGLLVYQQRSNGDDISYQPAINGTYIVVVGDKTFKIMVK